MFGAVISIIFGTIPFFIFTPLLIPLLGMALGANAIIKESRKEVSRKAVIISGGVGVLLCLITIAYYFLNRNAA